MPDCRENVQPPARRMADKSALFTLSNIWANRPGVQKSTAMPFFSQSP